MNETIFSPNVRKTEKCVVCLRLTDAGKHCVEEIHVFTNRTKVFHYLGAMGTIYMKPTFNQPIVTYKTFAEKLKTHSPLIVYVAGTGIFVGRFLILIHELE
jgi:hypothetical protein